MQLVTLSILGIGIILINAETFEGTRQSGSVEMRDSSEDPMVSFYKGAPHRNGPIPLVGLIIKARSHGYCLRRLSSLVPGTADGFKGWKRKYNSGYVAVAEKLYLMFRCDNSRDVERAQRVRRQPMYPPFPPRPCVNGTMAPGSADGEQESATEPTMEGEAVLDGMEGLGNEEEERQEEQEQEQEEEEEESK